MTRAVAVWPVELADGTIPVGEIFDCPEADYETLLGWGAIRAADEPADEPAAAAAATGRRGRPPADDEALA